MKKLIAFLLVVLLTTPCYASTITFDNISAFTDLTTGLYNNNLNKLYSKINTDIDGDNIANGSINSDDLATPVSPLIREQENIGEYVYTGLTLPTTGAATSATITAGTAYITKDADATLHRVVTATSSAISTFDGYTVNQDNWVYLDYAGSFKISAVGIGASQPSDLANSIVLGYCTVNSGGSVTTAVETARQTTPPSLRIYTDYVTGLVVSRDITDADIVTVGRGEIDLGSSGSLRRNTSSIDIDFDVSGEGGLAAADTYSASTYYYLYTYPDPANSTNYKGIAGSAATGVADITNERLVGWAYSNASTNISTDSFGTYKGLGSSSPNVVSVSANTDITTTATAPTVMDGMYIRFYSSGRPLRLTWGGNISVNANVTARVVLSADNTFAGDALYDGYDSNAYDQMSINKVIKMEAGTHTITAKWYVASNTGTEKGTLDERTLTVQEL